MSGGEFFLRFDAWPLLLAAPILGLLLVFARRRHAAETRRALGPRAEALISGPRPRRTAPWIFAAAVFMAGLAVLQPVWGPATVAVESKGVDLVVCLDVSRSMLARDVHPSRLVRARDEIRALTERAGGNRIGLVLFAGDARLAVPLTRDMTSLSTLVGLANPLSVNRGGTNLGAALTTALAALQGATGEHEAIFLLSDGEDLEGAGFTAAQTAAESNIVVHCIGFGSPKGGKIPVRDSRGTESFLRDRQGAEVISTMDATGLKRIATATGGRFLDAHSHSNALLELYESRVVPMARAVQQQREKHERENRYQWPLSIALLFFVVDLAGSGRKR